MKTIKSGQHRLFECDPETSRIVSEMLSDLEQNGMDAVRKYSEKFDNYSPESFELTPAQIDEAIARLSKSSATPITVRTMSVDSPRPS